MRWAQLRRVTFPLYYLPELLAGCVAPVLAAMGAAWLAGGSPLAVGAGVLAVWLGAEALLARAGGWPLRWSSPLAWLARDLLLPVVWIWGWTAQTYQWRGTTVEVAAARAS